MYYADHNPAHFHARYQEYVIVIDIQSLAVMKGKFPKRALALVLEWANEHRNELMEDWKKARNGEKLLPITPLD